MREIRARISVTLSGEATGPARLIVVDHLLPRVPAAAVAVGPMFPHYLVVLGDVGCYGGYGNEQYRCGRFWD